MYCRLVYFIVKIYNQKVMHLVCGFYARGYLQSARRSQAFGRGSANTDLNSEMGIAAASAAKRWGEWCRLSDLN